jgi:hypothetical protein
LDWVENHSYIGPDRILKNRTDPLRRIRLNGFAVNNGYGDSDKFGSLTADGQARLQVRPLTVLVESRSDQLLPNDTYNNTTVAETEHKVDDNEPGTINGSTQTGPRQVPLNPHTPVEQIAPGRTPAGEPMAPDSSNNRGTTSSSRALLASYIREAMRRSHEKTGYGHSPATPQPGSRTHDPSSRERETSTEITPTSINEPLRSNVPRNEKQPSPEIVPLSTKEPMLPSLSHDEKHQSPELAPSLPEELPFASAVQSPLGPEPLTQSRESIGEQRLNSNHIMHQMNEILKVDILSLEPILDHGRLAFKDHDNKMYRLPGRP